MVRAECAERPGAARALYVTAKEKRVVIVRAFIKKTEKTYSRCPSRTTEGSVLLSLRPVVVE